MMKTIICSLIKTATVLGVMVMITTSACAAPSFKLEPPQYYFSDSMTLELLSAAMAGDRSTAEQLVVKGANPNDEGPRNNPYNRLRLLHYAIAANNAHAIKILIAVGADPEMKTQGFGRAVLFAMTLDNLDMLGLLLDFKPVTSLSANTLESLLFRSVAIPRPRCLELLLKRGAPIDFPDVSKSTILMRAMDAQDYDMAEWLLQQGASIDVEAGGEVTPAYSVEFHLNKFIPGSPTYNKVLHLKQLMEERGAVFPALSPAEIRAKRASR